MTKYLITLEPIGLLFFGSDIGFRNVDNTQEKGSYIVKSNKLPQQTSVLGMLRKEILIQSGLYKENWDYSLEEREEINKLIGSESFNAHKSDQSFGIIKRISPVMLYKEGEFFAKTPKDHNIRYDKYTPFKLSSNKIKTNFGDVCLPCDYLAKEGLNKSWMKLSDGSIVEEDSIFLEDGRAGIKIKSSGKTEENSFYKMISYRLQAGYRFSFTLELSDESKGFELADSVVLLGAEGTTFKMKVQKLQQEVNIMTAPINADGKVVLISDAYLDNDIFNYCEFAITETVDFRSMRTTYSANGSSYGGNRLSKNKEKYNLIQRGSVFYTGNKKQFLDKLMEYRTFTMIGLNYSFDAIGGK